MRFYTILLVLFCLQAVGMESAQQQKQDIVKSMLALTQPDYESKYDQVMELDLSELGKNNPAITIIPDTGQVVYDSSVRLFVEERKLLTELAVTEEYAPLIPVLFNKWKHSEIPKIAAGMLLHAVCADKVANTQELLNVGVNPNQWTQYFFQDNNFFRSIVAVALGIDAPEERMRSRELITLLFANGRCRDTEINNRMLPHVVDNYLPSGDMFAIKTLVENGADPSAHVPMIMKLDGKYYGSASPHGLVSELAKVENKFSELKQYFDECTKNTNR